MKVKFIVITVVSLLASFVFIRYFFSKQDQYIFGEVEKRTVYELVSESGVISSNRNTEVFSPTNGIVENIYVANGDQVKAGQKLFSVKSTATPQEKSEAYAQYQAAKSALKQAENNKRGTQSVVDRVHDDVRGHDKDETFLQKESRTVAEVQNDNAYSALLAAQAQLYSAQTRYFATQNSTITAPASGTISNLSVTTGSNVAINSPLAPTSPVLLITGTGVMELKITTGETSINKISPEQIADIKFDAVEGKTYQGVVRRYDQSGTHQLGVAKYNIYLEVVSPDDNLKPGMNADVDIITQKVDDALTVPNTAIKPHQKGRAVRVLGKDGKVLLQPVKTGIKGKEFTQILEGLTEGQRIIVALTVDTAPKASLF